MVTGSRGFSGPRLSVLNGFCTDAESTHVVRMAAHYQQVRVRKEPKVVASYG